MDWSVLVLYFSFFRIWLAHTRSLLVPVVVISLGAFLINRHAEPVDDCPCFEDAIAFVSVVMGTTLAQWHAANWGYTIEAGYFVSKTPGWEGKDFRDWMAWMSFSLLKMVVG